MTRLLLSCTAAVLLAPVLAQPVAAATTAKKPAAHAAHHTTRHATPVVRRGNDPQGNAAVDALNAQSLSAARGGTAAPATPAAR